MKDYSEITTGPYLHGDESAEDLEDRQEEPQAGDDSVEDFQARKPHAGEQGDSRAGSLDTQGHTPPHNMSSDHKQATGKKSRFQD